MLFRQPGRADPLRETGDGLGCRLGRPMHLGITKAPRRWTLSHDNEHHPAAVFEDPFRTALGRPAISRASASLKDVLPIDPEELRAAGAVGDLRCGHHPFRAGLRCENADLATLRQVA